MSIKNISSSGALAAVYRRVSAIKVTIPDRDTPQYAFVRFEEEDVFSDGSNSRSFPAESGMSQDLDVDSGKEYTLYDSSTANDFFDLSSMTVDDIMKADNADAPLTSAKAVGTFNHKQFADMLFSMYISTLSDFKEQEEGR
jgi:hypothetical protein